MILRHYTELAMIDAEISRVEDSIVLLVRQRAQLKRKRNTFSPAVNLPPEVLSRIFEYACLPKGEIGGLGEVYQVGRCLPGATNLGVCVGLGAVTPLFLSTVCASWRKIALTSSQLWNSITVHLDEKHPELQAALLQHWLERSRLRPLRINVVEDLSHEDNEDADDSWGLDSPSTAVIDVLTSYSTQWHTVDLFLPSSWKSALSRIRTNLPNLSSLTLRVAEGSPSISRVDAFSLAPRLRDVTLIGYSFSDIILPWSQLERVEGEYVNIGESLDTLRLCPSLREYQFTQQCKGVLPFGSTSIVHEHLESFELILDSAMELRVMLEALTLPNLQELVLSLSEEQPFLPHVVSLVRRSGCAKSLKRLHLVGLMPQEEDLMECLWQLPSLEVLLLINPVMTGGKLTERFIRVMTPQLSDCEVHGRGMYYHGMDGGGMDVESEPEHSALFLPRLTRFEYQGLVTFSNHSLVEMLESRWHSAQSGRIDYDADDYPTPPPSSRFTHSSWAPPTKNRLRVQNVARLSSVVFTTERLFRFVEDDAQVIQELMGEGLHLEFVREMS